MKDVSAIGYHYYESLKQSLQVFADNPDEQWIIAAEYGLKPISFYFHLTDDPVQDLKQAKEEIALLARHEIGIVSLQAMGVEGGRPSKEQLVSTVDTLNKFGALSQSYGIKSCLHPHLNTAITFEEDIDFAMCKTDPSLVFMAPDTAHLKAAGCDPLSVMTRYADRIRFLHLKDLEDASATVTGYQAGVEVFSNFAELGKGDIDFEPIAKLLKDIGYDGYYTAELDITKRTNKESAAANYDFMNSVFFS